MICETISPIQLIIIRYFETFYVGFASPDFYDENNSQKLGEQTFVKLQLDEEFMWICKRNEKQRSFLQLRIIFVLPGSGYRIKGGQCTFCYVAFRADK